ncbi:MAG: hypothetical protein ACI8Q1_002501, partial [Parvicella sp.]
MNKIIGYLGMILLSISSIAQSQDTAAFNLDDFLRYDPWLAHKVDQVFSGMNDSAIVGQLIVPSVGKHGKSDEHVFKLAEKGLIGGVLLL